MFWGEVTAGSDRPPEAWLLAPVAEVVDALHDGARVAAVFATGPTGSMAAAPRRPERSFVVVEHPGGGEGIALAEPASPGRELVDLMALNGSTTPEP